MTGFRKNAGLTILFMAFFTIAFFGTVSPVGAQIVPLSLKDVPVPEPPSLSSFVRNKAAAIALGKALFWDMQVGSDGIQACATCHFNAGVDNRTKNQLSPGLLDGDSVFGNPVTGTAPGAPRFRPNLLVKPADFPFHKRVPATQDVPRPESPFFNPVSPDREFATIVRDTNDAVTSQGVRATRFLAIRAGKSREFGELLFDPIFNVSGITTRRSEPRNAPSIINAVFNFDNFWDGRASAVFNGVNPFGFRDIRNKLKRVMPDGTLADEFIRIPNGSLASQAVGPPLSDFEMSYSGRTWSDVGRKLLALRPLAKQMVHPRDSVLGPYARSRLPGRMALPGNKGLIYRNYAAMVKAAFQPTWWKSNRIITIEQETALVSPPTGIPLMANQYTLMEYNFSLFFGLAVQLYEATLVADDTPFDRYMGAPLNVRGARPLAPDPTALTDLQKLGLDIFQGTNLSLKNRRLVDGRCTFCHGLPETSNHTVRQVRVDGNGVPRALVEVMFMGNAPKTAFYENGIYNIAYRRTAEDIGRAATAPDAPPFRNPLDGNKPFPLSYAELALLKARGKLPAEVASFVPDLPVPCPDGFFSTPETGPCSVPAPENNRIAVRGSLKTPSLRNQQYQGPYFHDGGSSTLRQVVEFYVRGGNFPATNFDDFDPDIAYIRGMDPFVSDADEAVAAEGNILALIAFLADGLTDERVKFERAPFDHPELLVPHGSTAGPPPVDNILKIPPIGRRGNTIPVSRFLNLRPQSR